MTEQRHERCVVFEKTSTIYIAKFPNQLDIRNDFYNPKSGKVTEFYSIFFHTPRYFLFHMFSNGY